MHCLLIVLTDFGAVWVQQYFKKLNHFRGGVIVEEGINRYIYPYIKQLLALSSYLKGVREIVILRYIASLTFTMELPSCIPEFGKP